MRAGNSLGFLRSAEALERGGRTRMKEEEETQPHARCCQSSFLVLMIHLPVCDSQASLILDNIRAAVGGPKHDYRSNVGLNTLVPSLLFRTNVPISY